MSLEKSVSGTAQVLKRKDVAAILRVVWAAQRGGNFVSGGVVRPRFFILGGVVTAPPGGGEHGSSEAEY